MSDDWTEEDLRASADDATAFAPEEPPILADGYPGGFARDGLGQAYLTADERADAEQSRWDSLWWMS
jgi:hypothetical protein